MTDNTGTEFKFVENAVWEKPAYIARKYKYVPKNVWLASQPRRRVTHLDVKR